MREIDERVTATKVVESDTKPVMIEEKLLKGNSSPILRKIFLEHTDEVNNIRLHLSGMGLKSAVVFAGQVANLISPEQYDEYYKEY